MASKGKIKKVEINYPPIPLRKWKPPHKPHHANPQHRKEMLRKPEFPHSAKLHPSTLEKVWHKYKIVSKRCAVLHGTHAQCDPKYSLRMRGKQGAANCFVAIAYSKCREMEKWEERSLTTILDIGSKLYHQSVAMNKGTCTCTSPKEVHNTFFIGAYNMVLGIENNIVTGTLFKMGDVPCLMDALTEFFATPGHCCLEINGKFVAIWKYHGSYYLFDPNDRDEDAVRCKEGTGKSAVLKFLDVPALVENLWDNCGVPNANLAFTMTPILIKKFGLTNLSAPKNLQEVQANQPTKPKKTATAAKPHSCLTSKPFPRITSFNAPMSGVLPGTIKPPIAKRIPGKDLKKARISVTKRGKKDAEKPAPPQTPSNTPSIDSLTNSDKVMLNKKLVPVEKPKVVSQTYFHEVSVNKFGIIQASYAQSDPNFSKYHGKQSLGNAVAALTMLRVYKSKLWFTKVVNEILVTGETVYRESRRNLIGDIPLGIHTLTKKISLNNKLYTPEIEECTVLGKLNSNRHYILDLLPALEEFFTDNDTGIIRGPLLLAIWSEEGKYYMFDPNDRDKNGKVIVRDYDKGDSEETEEPGFACVTWFISLADLANLYMENVSKALRREHFYISKVEIKDYVEIPMAWNNFTALRFGKWILRGTISQNNERFCSSSRNTQCTAISTIAIAYTRLKTITFWDRDTVDEILTEGDTYYLECVKVLKAKSKFQDKMLMMAETLNRYTLLENELNLEIEDCLINGLLKGAYNSNIPDLKQGFVEFFRDNDAGVLTARSLSVSFWKYEDAYFYFDSHSRDENGYNSCGGTACVLRLTSIDDLTRIIIANLGAGPNDLYNIARVAVSILERTEGVIKPKFNNYTELSVQKGILRACSHQGSKDLYDVHSDKQTISNLLVSLGMSSMYPSSLWEEATLNQILEIGNRLYMKSRVEKIKKDLMNAANWESQEEPTKLDLIDVESVLKEFKIGVNKIEIGLTEPKEGIFETEQPTTEEPRIGLQQKSLKDVLSSVLNDEEDPCSKREAILESSELSVAVWKDAGLYYLFDPMCRDQEGNCYGRDLWSEKIVPMDEQMEEEMIEEEIEVEEIVRAPVAIARRHKSKRKLKSQVKITEIKHVTSETRISIPAEEEVEPVVEEETLEEEVLDMLLNYEAELKQTHESSEGAACTLLFATLDELADHIIENVRPNKRSETYKVHPVTLTARTDLKVHTDPAQKTAGNWHDFAEIDRDRWILRGTINLTNETFPEYNRGKQYGSMCVTACVFGRLYALSKFKPRTIDDLMKYGDRMHTVVRKDRESDLMANYKDLGLSEDEVKQLAGRLEIRATETGKKFYLAENLVSIEVHGAAVEGDLTAEDPVEEPVAIAVVEIKAPAKGAKVDKQAVQPNVPPSDVTPEEPKIPSLKKGLKTFFDNHNFGVLNAKQVSVAVWKLSDCYYMFDPDSRGPCGIKEVNGTACITRFRNIDQLADIFMQNLEKDGSNAFAIDKVVVKSKDAKKPQPEVGKVIPTDPKITAFHEISPGKLILRGDFHQDNPKFGLLPNAACCTNALVALAMAQIHCTETWTKPIIDEIITSAFTLFKDSANKLGFEFNSWEDDLRLDMVNREFNIGVMKVHIGYDLEGVKKGILNIKDPKIDNLRRGLEEFFYQNKQGIIQSNTLTTAIWTDKNLFYMFDPNQRGPTGLYQTGGTACLAVFKNIKLLSDHFLQNVPEYLQVHEFTITPVEVVVGQMKVTKEAPVRRTDILKVTEIDSLASTGSETKEAKGVKKVGHKKLPKCRLVKEKKKDPCCCPTKNKVVLKKNIEGAWKPKAAEEKKQILHKKMDAKQLRETQVFEQRMRKEFYELQNGDAILRAHYSQNSETYSPLSRNKQTIANGVVAIVMFKLHEPRTWTCKNIEIILDSADVLYKDSYIQYRPRNPLLGLKNILRNFYILHFKIKTTIYKPVIHGDLIFEDLYIGLLNFFMQETSGILACETLVVAVFQKAGQYYMFDPHDRNEQGLKTKDKGVACLLRFAGIENLVAKFLANSYVEGDTEDTPKFSVTAVVVESIQRTGK